MRKIGMFVLFLLAIVGLSASAFAWEESKGRPIPNHSEWEPSEGKQVLNHSEWEISEGRQVLNHSEWEPSEGRPVSKPDFTMPPKEKQFPPSKPDF